MSLEFIALGIKQRPVNHFRGFPLREGGAILPPLTDGIGPTEVRHRMRVSVRSSSARRARDLQDVLVAAGVEAAALVGPMQRQRLAPEDIAILDAHPDARGWALAEVAQLAALDARPGSIVAATDFAHPPTPGDDPFDGWIQTDGPAALMTRELAAARRSAIAREELSLRLLTAAACGGAPAFTAPQAGWRALYIGEPHPFFLTLERALARQHGRLEAAFSSFMGFDFLHDDRFDAVALNAHADSATALALCGALRRNARLHHLPTLMLADTRDGDFTAAAIGRGASLVIGARDDHDDAIAWLFSKIRRGRRETHVEAGLAAVRSSHAGPASLFGAPFFLRHMEALSAAAHVSGRPLALIGLRVALAPGARQASASGWRRGVYQVAEICGRLIRAEDSAALLDGDLIVIALPGADAREARVAAERVASVTECTAFAAGETEAGPIVLEQNVAELAIGESGAGLLARTRAAFDLQGVRA